MEKYRTYIASGAIIIALWAIFHSVRGTSTPRPPWQAGLSAYDYEAGYAGFNPIEAKDGALSWTIFAEVKEIERQEVDAHNPNAVTYWVEPRFTDAMRALDGTAVRLMGYMFPLDASDEQEKFLFGPYPATCPFHYHVNTNQVVEVMAPSPIPFTWDPIAVEGTLRLIHKDPQRGLFYRLEGAVLKETY